MRKIISLHSNDFYKRKANELFLQGMRLIGQNRYEEAKSCFVEAAWFEDTNGEYHFYAGITSYFLSQTKESIHFLSKAYHCEPHNLEYATSYGISLYRSKSYDGAIEVFNKIIEKHPNHLDANLYLGRSYFSVKQYEKAITHLNKADVSQSEKEQEIYFELGCSYMELAKYYQAIDYFLLAIHTFEKYPIAYHFLSKVYLKVGEFNKAIEILLELQKVCPEESKLVEKSINVINMLRSF